MGLSSGSPGLSGLPSMLVLMSAPTHWLGRLTFDMEHGDVLDQRRRPVSGPDVRIVQTPEAVTALLALREPDDATAAPAARARVDELFESIRDGGLRALRVEVRGARRPLWGVPVLGHTLWASVGSAAEGDGVVGEVRILAVTAESAPFGWLLHANGEADWRDPRSVVEVEVRREEEVFLSIEAADAAVLPADALRAVRFHRHNPWKEPEHLALRLGPEQEKLLVAPRPLLVQGLAGSGKTTVLVYAAARLLDRSPGARILLVVYSEELQRYVNSLLDILLGHGPARPVEVLTWRGLCDALGVRRGAREGWVWAPVETSSHAWSPELTAGRITAQDVREEIRGVLKGGAHRGHDVLPEAAYRKLADGADLHVLPSERGEVRRQAMEYQRHLQAQRELDDMDGARLLLDAWPDFQPWDYVLVDEAQDYTRIQLDVLVRLSGVKPLRPDRLILVGDEHQVVHPSRFTWNRVKDALRAAGMPKPPDPVPLEGNYRCPAPVMELATELVRLRSLALGGEIVGLPFTDRPPWPVPVRVQATREECERLLVALAERVASFGLLRPSGEEEREIDWPGVGFRRSFTPQTAKGIEFDVVCLDCYGDRYRHLLTGAGQQATPANIGFGFNEVFVSTTRTRGLLILLDVPAAGNLWARRELAERTRVSSVDEVLSMVDADYRIEGPADWRRAALEFEQQRTFEAAAECWDRGAEPLRAAWALARGGLHAKAAARLEAEKATVDAAGEWELAGRPHDAARLWEAVPRWSDAARCWESEAGGSRRDDKRAAAAWTQAGEHRRAAVCFERAGLHREAARAAADAGDLDRAAAAWHKIAVDSAGADIDAITHSARLWDLSGLHPGLEAERGRWSAAGGGWALWLTLLSGRWNRRGDVERAAECLELAGHHRAAAEVLRHGGMRGLAAAVLDRGGLHKESAELFATAGLHKRALEQWELFRQEREAAGDWSVVADILERHLVLPGAAAVVWGQNGQWGRAAGIYERLKQWRMAGSAWAEAGQPNRAAMAFERAELWEEAAVQWGKARGREAEANRDRCAKLAVEAPLALAAVAAGRFGEAAGIWEGNGLFARAAELFARDEDPRSEGRCWEKAGDLEQAAAAFESGGFWKEAGDVRMKDARYQEAADAYFEGSLWDLAAGARREHAAQQAARLEEEDEPLEAAEQWVAAGRLDNAVRVYLKAGRADLAAQLERAAFAPTVVETPVVVPGRTIIRKRGPA